MQNRREGEGERREKNYDLSYRHERSMQTFNTITLTHRVCAQKAVKAKKKLFFLLIKIFLMIFLFFSSINYIFFALTVV